jgi:hypothetical protein
MPARFCTVRQHQSRGPERVGAQGSISTNDDGGQPSNVRRGLWAGGTDGQIGGFHVGSRFRSLSLVVVMADSAVTGRSAVVLPVVVEY